MLAVTVSASDAAQIATCRALAGRGGEPGNSVMLRTARHRRGRGRCGRIMYPRRVEIGVISLRIQIFAGSKTMVLYPIEVALAISRPARCPASGSLSPPQSSRIAIVRMRNRRGARPKSSAPGRPEHGFALPKFPSPSLRSRLRCDARPCGAGRRASFRRSRYTNSKRCPLIRTDSEGSKISIAGSILSRAEGVRLCHMSLRGA